MGNKKHIIIAAILAALATGFNPANADNSSSLLQMDVKKSSVADTVDVTFFTTGSSKNSIVTRKSNNRYVVLLPNTSSSSSVTPSIGGVKDLITDVEVKHVNDGIGGYTKVTFLTTKPINIKTYTKHTAAISPAQQGYKNLLAQNNTKPAATTPAQKPQTSSPKTTKSQPAKPAQTTVKQTSEKPAAHHTTTAQSTNQKKTMPAVQQKSTQKQSPAQEKQIKTETKQSSAVKPVQPQKQQKVEQQVKPVQQTVPQETKSVQTQTTVQETSSPKMKFDENGNRIIDLEPKVSHKFDIKDMIPIPYGAHKDEVTNEQSEQTAQAADNTHITNTADKPQDNSKHLPLWLLIAGSSVLSLGFLFFIMNRIAAASARNNRKLEQYFSITSPNKPKQQTDRYEDIVNDIELNWQEKYKRYNEQIKQNNTNISKPAPKDFDYIANLEKPEKAIKPQHQPIPQQEEKSKPISSVLRKASKQEVSKPVGIKSIKSAKVEEFKKNMQIKISQMEHSLAQTPTIKEPKDFSNEVKSEDSSIINNITDIKLKSFSKPVSLRETVRTNYTETNKPTKNSYKEGRFVKLKNSPLSVSKRQSASTELNLHNIADINKNLKKNGEIKMNKENEKYLLSSLDEYLSILDSEQSPANSKSSGKISPIRNLADTIDRSNISNPVSKTTNPISATRNSASHMNGLIVKSGYNIDSNRGFYLINIDGVSALIGKVQDRTFILKKFDRVIDGPLKVRQDDTNVYIVKAGRYKCLVDVSKDRMGTLVEI